mmetsp:Transcript_5709/g.13653  ORF Transcript_5709/g.13653 Transcript_5709/m.13653 type:complete len:1053 (+) Transcript_5709:106-3264(+)
MDPFPQPVDQMHRDKRQTVSKKMRVKIPGFGRKSSVNDTGDNDGMGGREHGSRGVEYSRHARPQKTPQRLYSRGSREDLLGYNDRSDSNESILYSGGMGPSSGVLSESTTSKFSQSSSLFGSGASSISNKFFRETNYDASIQAPASSIQIRGSDADYAQEDDENKKVRVKPYSAFPSATYMNEIELYQCMMAGSSRFEFLTSYLDPSTKVTRRAKVPDIVRRQFGSPKEDGRVGSLRIEILGCVGLDRAKPEVSVYAVCGDCAFTTDIIDGNRSPMWPNSSKRAAVFPLHHAYARAFIGVFDVKQQKEREADHLCGRVTIDVPSLRPDTEYDITFPLRVSSFIYDRRPRGVVRVRFSIHWFSERSAILSYLKRPRNPLAFSKQAKKFPTIPCGDPKTFRNVAVTVHGQDFPGKYTRSAFRATMREFNLSQQNIRFLMKVLILDCILYENPLMSIYLFSTSMYCVYLNSVRLAPPFFVGWLIYLLVENNIYFNGTQEGNLGYRDLTIKEIFFGLLFDGKNDKYKLNPISVKKLPRRQVVGEDGKRIDIELQNHREFPFSERFEYPKFSAADAIASSPATNKKAKKKDKGAVPIDINSGEDSRTARRLSIYTASTSQQQEEEVEESEEESEEESQDGEDEEGDGMLDGAEYGYENMDESDEEYIGEESPSKSKRKARILETGKASKHRRIRIGPQQNNDKSGNKKLPPQAHLSRVENMLHRASKNISVEHVYFPPPQLQTQLGKEVNAKGPAGDVLTAKEKKHYDEFDKLLGYRLKNPNPIVRITSSFLGPLMRIIRIAIYTFRISFNVCTWKDPYLTFWLFSFLCLLAFVLLIFPWRSFFFFSSLVLLGPQNIAVRKYLERRANRREREEKEEKEREALKAQLKISDPLRMVQPQLQQSNASLSSGDRKKEESGGKKKRIWGLNRKKEDEIEQSDEIREAEMFHSPRPAFFAHTKPSKRTQVPRDVAVPYFRFRKDRFYDWPPDPTVSRATPMLMMTRFEEGEDVGFQESSINYNGSLVSPQVHGISSIRGLRNRGRSSRDRHSGDDVDYQYG